MGVFSIAQAALAISNGQTVSPTDSIKSVTVSIYSNDDECTGVKVAPRFILTARHCRINDTTRIIFSDGTRYKIIGYFKPSRKPETVKNEHDFLGLDYVPRLSSEGRGTFECENLGH